MDLEHNPTHSATLHSFTTHQSQQHSTQHRLRTTFWDHPSFEIQYKLQRHSTQCCLTSPFITWYKPQLHKSSQQNHMQHYTVSQLSKEDTTHIYHNSSHSTTLLHNSPSQHCITSQLHLIALHCFTSPIHSTSLLYNSPSQYYTALKSLLHSPLLTAIQNFTVSFHSIHPLIPLQLTSFVKLHNTPLLT